MSNLSLNDPDLIYVSIKITLTVADSKEQYTPKPKCSNANLDKLERSLRNVPM